MSYADRELIKKKNVLRASTELLKLGGIIREVIEEEYLSLYPEDITDLVCKDHEIGPHFFMIADELTEVKEELMEKYEYFLPNESDKNESLSLIEDYKEWYLEQTARLCYEKYEKGYTHFWQDWKMTYRAKKRMASLRPVEERILYLSWGLDQNGKKRSAKELAELPEFECGMSYVFIQKVKKSLKGYLYEGVSKDVVEKEIVRMCETERSIAAQKVERDK